MNVFSLLIRGWYRLNHRNLPWRVTHNPYEIWLSEVVLQQTRVDQGLSYYLKLVNKYPTVFDLAAVEEQELLKDWQGLGYYSRARNLHAAAKQIVADFDGKFPGNYKEILKLKGVGEYTAAAISSFAFNEVQAVVDGNVYRVLSRYFNDPTPIDSSEGKKTFRAYANELIDKNEPAEHNQAIMELGALVCKPANPDCISCPLQETCLSFREGNQTNLPVKAKKVKVTKRFFHYLVYSGDSVQLEKREEGIWRNMFQFPVVEVDKVLDSHLVSDAVQEEYSVGVVRKVMEKKHLLSHQHIYATFWETDNPVKSQAILNVHLDNLEEYPLPKLIALFFKEQPEFFE
ncbi:MAG TPA: A/G-specific adenine glycosylase [Brumimicrobium sp.]|nr:A/G-specific adenine glycosylase [Brumimicrobium sp.]